MTKVQKFNSFLGIDVSKNKLDIYNSQTGEFTKVKNNRTSIRRFCESVTPQNNLLIVVDLTGGYEQICVDIFHECGFHIHRAEGRRVKAFLKSYGQFAKTDKMDARALTFFGDKLQETLFLYTPKNDKLQSYLEAVADIAQVYSKLKIASKHQKRQQKLYRYFKLRLICLIRK